MLKYFYGAMGSSKSTLALTTRFNYVEKGFNVLLIKSNIDNREALVDNKPIVRSRIGIFATCQTFSKDDNIDELFIKNNLDKRVDLVVVDEVQFCTQKQVEQLKWISSKIPVYCYGLKTNYKSELFEGSKRMVELCDTMEEVPSICKCGKPAIINAKKVNEVVVKDGFGEIEIGGNEKYEAMCYDCWIKALNNNVYEN